jgi:hypothetical protein
VLLNRLQDDIVAGKIIQVTPSGIFFNICSYRVLLLFWYWTKDGMLWIFPAGKNPKASMQTPRPQIEP